MSKIYTKFGDEGQTMTLKGETVPKNDCLIKVNGDLDSLQSSIDKVLLRLNHTPYRIQLEHIQTLLWQLGGEISAGKIDDNFIKTPITKDHIKDLEDFIDMAELKITGFVRFNDKITIDINEARVRTRKLERTLTDYLLENRVRATVYKWINRLSDYFFALAVIIKTDK